ncbi:BTB/POZ domain-containing protein 9 [Lamellibrachia satsuma]|nr:BTB/POZ domain-containing protein 9 [Lamellibrachia satsuma]
MRRFVSTMMSPDEESGRGNIGATCASVPAFHAEGILDVIPGLECAGFELHPFSVEEDLLLDVLGLSHQYGFVELQSAISAFLKDNLKVVNVCLIYDIASLYALTSLAQACCEFMICNAADVLHSDAFYSLSPSAVKDIISWDAFCASEIEIFHAVQSWVGRNPESDATRILHSIRLPLMSLDELLNVVRPSNLLAPDSILDAIKTKTESRDMELGYRGFLSPEENVATLRHGATVIRGEMKASLLDGDSQNYDLDRGFTRHPIDDNHGQGIVIKLGKPCIINTVRMLLWDRDMRWYSYYIEVSMDDKDWVRVVDHSHFPCRSWQKLHFAARVVRYVRIVGTHNTVNRVFHLVTFECIFSNEQFMLEDGILVPKENVATISASACVIEGVSRSRNALINGDTKNYDWDSGYTCHQLGSGAIVVQLAQPYIISSMRMLLWDCDGRSYSYYVAVSTNQQQWHTVTDRTKVQCKSWQSIKFRKMPVTFVKIVGTHNTANEVFHCVHFEAPADQNALVDQSQRSQEDIQSLPPDDGAAAINNQHVVAVALVRSDSPTEEMEEEEEDNSHGVVAMALAPVLHLQRTGSGSGESRRSPELPDDGFGGAIGGP